MSNKKEAKAKREKLDKLVNKRQKLVKSGKLIKK